MRINGSFSRESSLEQALGTRASHSGLFRSIHSPHTVSNGWQSFPEPHGIYGNIVSALTR